MIRIAVVVGSTRPRRRTAVVAEWVLREARSHPDVTAGRADVALLDLAAFGLPVLDEPVSAAFGRYEHAHTRRWSEAVASHDAFVFVTPEYNHSFPGALKNALDYLYTEWFHKAAGFVSHGVTGGTRAVEHLRTVLAELKVATVAPQVALNAFTDFEITDPTLPGTLTPGPHHAEALNDLLDDLIPWAEALGRVRAARGVRA
ncbi:NADPH-dependent FMN reductase [Streptomyces marincola]|uniref:NADPH-dependent FMN reductase n=1 Tax=Streptomyces marincola TaxID=2878388 RepID=A0A1W7D4M0_9ACTN|nr:NAD(P)H-dependent oxidoreductase [Streptomyces marincola]ARQ71510.1 NADPH-dependent FMN reductase [Streptomyces marincola]